jgi:hypothetical protein
MMKLTSFIGRIILVEYLPLKLCFNLMDSLPVKEMAENNSNVNHLMNLKLVNLMISLERRQLSNQ